jgi:hypothetical protein
MPHRSDLGAEMHMTERGIHSATCSTPETEVEIAPKAVSLIPWSMSRGMIKHRGWGGISSAQLSYGSVLPVISGYTSGYTTRFLTGKTMSSHADHMRGVLGAMRLNLDTCSIVIVCR